MDRRTLLRRLATLGSVATATMGVGAAPARGARRLAVLLFEGTDNWDGFVRELRDELALLGWKEGGNLEIELNYAGGDVKRLHSLASRIVTSAPDVVLTRGAPATRALRDVSQTIPIATGVGDPIGSGFAKTFAEPGGNVTGLSWANAEASAKHVEILRLLFPRITALLVIWPVEYEHAVNEGMRPVLESCRAAGIDVRTALVSGLAEFESALREARNRRSTAALSFGLGSIMSHETIATAALLNRVPTMFDHPAYAQAGGLASFRFVWPNATKRAASQLDKLFRGERPGRIPFELPTHEEFILNLKTARALDLVVPLSLRLRADLVIE